MRENINLTETVARVNSQSVGLVAKLSSKISDYKLLVKLRLNYLAVFSAVMAYLISAKTFDLKTLIFISIGGFLVTGASNGMNQILEREYDKLMKRTCDRPLASGRMNVSEAILAVGVMLLSGTLFLAEIYPLCGFLGMIAFALYAFVYTPMKRFSPVAVIIGAIPGAMPITIGCIAASGTIESMAFVLFGIQFFWQFAHFWAIAWLGKEDYEKAGFQLLPSENGHTIGFYSICYSLPLLVLGSMPFYFGEAGLVSFIIVILSSLVYIYFAWKMFKQPSRESARSLMFSSFAYLPIVLISLLADKL